MWGLRDATTKAAVLFSLLAAVVVVAEKDDNFFANGGRNPNSKKAMYWRDSRNVLQDLSQFQSLSVKYHGCAWSELVPDNDGQSHDNGDNDDESGAFCNTIDYGEGDDENNAYDWWYLGKTSCKRANVAFSLYGTRMGTADGGCKKSTYINSFFTNQGISPFLAAMQEAGEGNFQSDDLVNNIDSHCTITKGSVYNDDGVYYRDDDSYEYFAYGTHNEQYFMDMYSRSLFCTKRGKFVKESFEGPFCESSRSVRTVDNMNQLNNALNSASCVEIYNADTYGNNNQNSGDKDDDANYEGALSLLEYSQACSLRDPSGACPDPHGKLSSYSRALDRVTKGLDATSRRRRVRNAFSVLLILLSLVMFTLSTRMLIRRCLRNYPSIRKRLGRHRIANALKTRRRRRRKKSSVGVGDQTSDGIYKNNVAGDDDVVSPKSSSSRKSRKSKTRRKERNSSPRKQDQPRRKSQSGSDRHADRYTPSDADGADNMHSGYDDGGESDLVNPMVADDSNILGDGIFNDPSIDDGYAPADQTPPSSRRKKRRSP